MRSAPKNASGDGTDLDQDGSQGIDTLEDIPGAVMMPSGMSKWEMSSQPHPFTGIEVTEKGVDRLCEYVAAVREAIGYDMPLSMDHLGHIGVKSGDSGWAAPMRSDNLESIEDVIPWVLHRSAQGDHRRQSYADAYRRGHLRICGLREAMQYTRSGQDSSGSRDLRRDSSHAQDRRHRHSNTACSMAMHFAGTPVSCMAQLAPVPQQTRNFLALENHSLDVPFWQDLVHGIEKPIVQKGYIKVTGSAGPRRCAQ